MTKRWIEILKTGTFTAKNGTPVTITGSDLDNIVKNNPSSERPAPLVFGHPEDDQPAYGWVEAVKRKGDILLAAFKEVPDVVKSLVRDGYYRKVSVSLMPDKKTLRHVGLLGAVQPAVPGLKDVKFASGDEDLIIEFSMSEPSDGPGGDPDDNNGKPNKNKEGSGMTIEELQKQLADEKAARITAEGKLKTVETEAETAKAELSAGKETAAKTAVETKINKLVGKKILAKDKAVVEQVALALGGSDEIELSSGAGKKNLQDHLFDFLSGLPDLELMNEFSDPGDKGEKEADVSGLTDCV